MFTNGYAAIREDPTFKSSEKSAHWKEESRKHRSPALTHEQRKERIKEKISLFHAGQETAADDDDDDDE
jgi:large subunit ribosomal protein L5e